METKDLIDSLAAGAEAPARTGLGGIAMPAAGFAVTLVLFCLVYGLRPDLLAHLTQPFVAAKTVLPVLLALLATPLVRRAVHPGESPGRPGVLIWLVPTLAALALGVGFAVAPDGQRMLLFIGHSIPVCLPSIPALSVPVLTGILWVMRRGAPTRPRFAGAMAGLLAGGLGAAVYSLFCVEDSPLFYAVWYSVGILLTALIGSLAGNRWLRW